MNEDESSRKPGRQIVILGAARTTVPSNEVEVKNRQGDGNLSVSFPDEPEGVLTQTVSTGEAEAESIPNDMEGWIESIRTSGSATFQPATPQLDPFPNDRPGFVKEQTPVSTAQVLGIDNAKPPKIDWRDFYTGVLDSDDSSVSSGSLSDIDEASLAAHRAKLERIKKRQARLRYKKLNGKASEKGKAGVPATTTRRFLTAAYLKPKGKIGAIPSKVWLRKLGYTSNKKSLDQPQRHRRRQKIQTGEIKRVASTDFSKPQSEDEESTPGVNSIDKASTSEQQNSTSAKVTLKENMMSKSQRSLKTTESEISAAAAAAGVDSGTLLQVQTKLKAAIYGVGADTLAQFVDSVDEIISGFELTNFLRHQLKIPTNVLSDDEITTLVSAFDNTNGLGLVTIEDLKALLYMENSERKISREEENMTQTTQTKETLPSQSKRNKLHFNDRGGNDTKTNEGSANNLRQARRRWRALYKKLTLPLDSPVSLPHIDGPEYTITRASIQQRLRKHPELMQEFGEVLGLTSVVLDEDELMLLFDNVLFEMMSQHHDKSRKAVLANGGEVVTASAENREEALWQIELTWEKFSSYLHRQRVRQGCHRKVDKSVLLPGSNGISITQIGNSSLPSSPSKAPRSPRKSMQSQHSETDSIDAGEGLNEDEVDFFNLLLRNKAHVTTRELSPEIEAETQELPAMRRTISVFSGQRSQGNENEGSVDDELHLQMKTVRQRLRQKSSDDEDEMSSISENDGIVFEDSKRFCSSFISLVEKTAIGTYLGSDRGSGENGKKTSVYVDPAG